MSGKNCNYDKMMKPSKKMPKVKSVGFLKHSIKGK